MANELTSGEKISRDLCEMDAPTDGIEVDPVDVARRIDSALEELRYQLAAVQAENERLKATPPDQRQDLHCVVSDIAAECRELHDQLTAARTALAAAEARESATRAILDQVMDDIRSEAFLFDGGNGISADTEDAADNLLDQPRDDSALREMIAGVYEHLPAHSPC